jgi:LysM repeat protein
MTLKLNSLLTLLLAPLAIFGLFQLLSSTSMLQLQATPTPLPPSQTASPVPQIQPTASPTATVVVTATKTLLPPPTFEPATQTPPPSATPSITPTATFLISVDIPGLRGAETATPSSTPGCIKREDWQLTYEVQANDALARIAERYAVYTSDLAAANCLDDPDTIFVGQTLRVPGEAHPQQAQYDCGWELLIPVDNTFAVEGDGTLTFSWRGPRAPRNLIRIVKPDGSFYERVIELRQNETIDLSEIPAGGTYTWYVYPLDQNFAQIACPEGGPWHFTKSEMPTPTATSTPGAGFGG